MLGMTTGPYCLTACFPMVLSVALAEGEGGSSSQTWLFVGKFIGGRFLAYLAFGVAIGLLGSRLGGMSHRIGTFAMIFMSIILIGYGLGVRLPRVGMCRMAGRTESHRFFPVILGALTGLNVCPPFLLAITYTLHKAVTPAFGICFFMSFFIATTLYILPVGIAGHIPHRDIMARMGRVAAVVVGAVFFYQGVSAALMLV